MNSLKREGRFHSLRKIGEEKLYDYDDKIRPFIQ